MKVGDAATISVPGQPASIKGKVSLVSPALDPSSTTVEVWVQAPNPGERLKPGSDVQVQIVAQTIPHAIDIPAEAMLTDSNGDKSVIMLDIDNKPHKRKVKAGIRDGDEVQITEGLQEGERVVTVGAFALYKKTTRSWPRRRFRCRLRKCRTRTTMMTINKRGCGGAQRGRFSGLGTPDFR